MVSTVEGLVVIGEVGLGVCGEPGLVVFGG